MSRKYLNKYFVKKASLYDSFYNQSDLIENQFPVNYRCFLTVFPKY